MARAKTPSFITELELLPTPRQAKKLRSRLEAARQVYNACLGECLRRLDLVRQSKTYNRARKMPKGKERTQAFREASKAHGFREYDLHHWATQFTHSWINEHIGSKSVESITTTAFNAANMYAVRVRGRPRFKRKGELDTIEGKSSSACKWRAPNIVWKGLTIPADIDSDDAVIQHGLACKVKYVRFTRRTIHGKERFFAQLVCEGTAYQKLGDKPGKGVVGLDLGPQTIAAVGDKEAFLQPFCAELENRQREIRRLQRALDRRRRANNPDNYNSNGTVRKGPKKWTASKRQKQVGGRIRELQRRQAAQRKNLHGQLINTVLQMGDDIRMEKVSYRSFQRMFGRSVGFRSPGIFVNRLKNAVEKYGASVTEFSTFETKLSQVCHNCGIFSKKSLSQRWHNCDCGVTAQRDLYSAFLARFVQGDRLDADQAKAAWSGACALLDAAFSRTGQQVMAGPVPASLGLRSAPSRDLSRRNLGKKPAKIADVVPAVSVGESREEAAKIREHTVIRWRAPPNGV